MILGVARAGQLLVMTQVVILNKLCFKRGINERRQAMRRAYRVDKKLGIKGELYKDTNGWGFNIKDRLGSFLALYGGLRTKKEAVEEFRRRWDEAIHAEDFA